MLTHLSSRPCRSAVPMIRETLCCGFSASIRESALAQLEAVFASPLGSSGGGAAAAAGAGGAGGAAAAAAGGVLGLGGGVGGVGLLPPGHYMWVLRALVGLRPDMEARLESCLEFHCLLCKVKGARGGATRRQSQRADVLTGIAPGAPRAYAFCGCCARTCCTCAMCCAADALCIGPIGSTVSLWQYRHTPTRISR